MYFTAIIGQFKDFGFPFASRADFIIGGVTASTVWTFEQQRVLTSALASDMPIAVTLNTVMVSEHTVSRGKTSIQFSPQQGGQQ